jgi:hypothetical protein
LTAPAKITAIANASVWSGKAREKRADDTL